MVQMINFVTISMLTMSAFLNPFKAGDLNVPEQTNTLVSQDFNLENRYQIQSVNDIFVDNILLTLLYMDNEVENGQQIDWEAVRKPGQVDFMLLPGETFAFHDLIAQDYQDQNIVTTNAHFNASEGFKSDGFIVGDGVCHLASFINVVATQAGLKVNAPVRHDFAPIPDIDKSFGTSINSSDVNQNMYITNTLDHPVKFIFEHNQSILKIDIISA